MDIEKLADFFRLLTLDHIRAILLVIAYVHSLAADIEEALNVQVIGSQDNLKEHFLVHLDELGIPFRNVSGTAPHLVRLIGLCRRVIAVVAAVFKHLGQHTGADIGQRNGLVRLSNIFDHLLNQYRSLCNIAIHSEMFIVRRGK